MPDPPPKLELRPCRKTQTFPHDLDTEKNKVDRDPFASEESLEEVSSEALSCIDSQVCQNIMGTMYKGCSDDETEVEQEKDAKVSSEEDDGESYVFDSDVSDAGVKKTKKRKRVQVVEKPAEPGVPGIFDRQGYNGRGTAYNVDLTG